MMDTETLEALKASVRRWRRLALAESREEVILGTDQCALCLLYHPAEANKLAKEDCGGCPVRERTGFGQCRATPYAAAVREYERLPFMVERPLIFFRKRKAEERVRAARGFQQEAAAMTSLLESLLPEGETA